MEHGGAGRPHRRGVDRSRPGVAMPSTRSTRSASRRLAASTREESRTRPGRAPRSTARRRPSRSPARPGWAARARTPARMAAALHPPRRPPPVRHDERRVGELRARESAGARSAATTARTGRPVRPAHGRPWAAAPPPGASDDRGRAAHDVRARVPEEVRDRPCRRGAPGRRRRRCGGRGCARRPSPAARSGAGRRRRSTGRRSAWAGAGACRRVHPQVRLLCRRGVEIDLPRRRAPAGRPAAAAAVRRRPAAGYTPIARSWTAASGRPLEYCAQTQRRRAAAGGRVSVPCHTPTVVADIRRASAWRGRRRRCRRASGSRRAASRASVGWQSAPSHHHNGSSGWPVAR